MPSDSSFTWRDGERTIHFGEGVVSRSHETLAEHRFEGYELLTTERAMGAAPIELAEGSACFHHVPPGQVNEVAAQLIDGVGDGPLVAIGGGRVIDVAKAIAAVRGTVVAALPTTLSGAEMTAIHRLPAGHHAANGFVRPQVVLADPPLMVTLAEQRLRASAMNALGHAADSLYAPGSNPVSELAALRGASLIAKALDSQRAKRDAAHLALGSVLSAYALDSAGLSLHHAVCQSLVRTLGIPHAETNAAMLPLTIAELAPARPKLTTALARALGVKRDDLPARIAELAGGPPRLSELGADPDQIDEAVAVVRSRGELEALDPSPSRARIRELIESAW